MCETQKYTRGAENAVDRDGVRVVRRTARRNMSRSSHVNRLPGVCWGISALRVRQMSPLMCLVEVGDFAPLSDGRGALR